MLFPYIILSLMALIILTLLLLGGLHLAEDARSMGSIDYGYIALVMGSVILYLLFAEYLGFILTASLILVLLMWQFKVPWSTALLVILIIVPLSYQLFAVYLRVPLPWGLLGW